MSSRALQIRESVTLSFYQRIIPILEAQTSFTDELNESIGEFIRDQKKLFTRQYYTGRGLTPIGMDEFEAPSPAGFGLERTPSGMDSSEQARFKKPALKPRATAALKRAPGSIGRFALGVARGTFTPKRQIALQNLDRENLIRIKDRIEAMAAERRASQRSSAESYARRSTLQARRDAVDTAARNRGVVLTSVERSRELRRVTRNMERAREAEVAAERAREAAQVQRGIVAQRTVPLATGTAGKIGGAIGRTTRWGLVGAAAAAALTTAAVLKKRALDPAQSGWGGVPFDQDMDFMPQRLPGSQGDVTK